MVVTSNIKKCQVMSFGWNVDKHLPTERLIIVIMVINFNRG